MAWPSSQPPKEISLDFLTRLPDHFRRPNTPSDHSTNQKRGRPVECFLEGPLCLGEDLYLTDIPFGRIFKVHLPTLHWSLIIEYDGEPNGLAWHPQRKEIIIADFKNGLLALNPNTGEVKTIMARFNGERLKGPNDVIVGKDGSIYFTDQGMSGLQDPNGRVYRIHEDGRVDVLLRNAPSPNGLALNKSESTLFVAMTRDNSVWHLPIYPDGSIQRTGRFSTYYGLGGPDGLVIDEEENLLVAHSSLGVVFVHKADGEPMAKLKSCKEKGITNLTWTDGEEGRRRLYVVESASGSILTMVWHCGGWLSSRYEN